MGTIKMNRMKRKIVIVFLLICSIPLGIVHSDQTSDKDGIVKIEIFTDSTKVHRKSQLKLALRVTIKRGWHINSNLPNDDFLIPTSLTIQNEDKFTSVEWKYPDSENLSFSFSEQPVSVYEGEILIGALITIPQEISLKKHTLPLLLEYQACNDRTCLAPQTTENNIEIAVVDDHIKIKKINQDIFSKIDFN